jgi:hypothetical protein
MVVSDVVSKVKLQSEDYLLGPVQGLRRQAVSKQKAKV